MANNGGTSRLTYSIFEIYALRYVRKLKDLTPLFTLAFVTVRATWKCLKLENHHVRIYLRIKEPIMRRQTNRKLRDKSII